MRHVLLILVISITGALAGAKSQVNPDMEAADKGYKVLIIPPEMTEVQKELDERYKIYQPNKATQTDSKEDTITKVSDQIVQKWLDSDAGAGVAQTVKTVENTMKAEVSVGGKQMPSGQKTTEHKFGFNLRAVEGFADVKYTGWFNSLLRYDTRGGQTLFEVSDKVLNSDLFVNHTMDHTEDKSSVGMRWTW